MIFGVSINVIQHHRVGRKYWQGTDDMCAIIHEKDMGVPILTDEAAADLIPPSRNPSLRGASIVGWIEPRTGSGKLYWALIAGGPFEAWAQA